MRLKFLHNLYEESCDKPTTALVALSIIVVFNALAWLIICVGISALTGKLN